MTTDTIPEGWRYEDPPEAYEGVPEYVPLTEEENLEAETFEYRYNNGLV